jgi:hypothetical protein
MPAPWLARRLGLLEPVLVADAPPLAGVPRGVPRPAGRTREEAR